MLENYASILEKTNNQLGVWTNPYGIMIGVLTLLVGLGAIGVTVWLWWNSAEQKKERKEFISKHEELLTKLAEESVRTLNEKLLEMEKKSNKQIETAETKINNLLIAQKEKLATADDENKKIIQQAINELEKSKAMIGLDDRYPNLINQIKAQTKAEVCSRCGALFVDNKSQRNEYRTDVRQDTNPYTSLDYNVYNNMFTAFSNGLLNDKLCLKCKEDRNMPLCG